MNRWKQKNRNQKIAVKKSSGGGWRQWVRNFMLCGLTGWGLEILLTSVEGFAAGDMKFMGKTSIYMFPIWNGNPFGAHREMGGQLDRRPGTDRGKGQDLPTWDPGHGPDLFRRIPHGDILEKPWDMSVGLHRANAER